MNNNGTLIRELLRKNVVTGRRRPVLGASGVPDFPQNVVAVKGNAQATISFTAPLSDGGSPITSYVVTSDPGNITNSGSASPIAVTGLTNGVSYTFRVHAVNANGNGVPSTPSNAVVPSTTPAAPTIGTASVAAISAISVPFTANSNGGDAVTHFTATSSPGGITAQSATSPITVTGLAPGTAYTFTVTATNSNGTSAASAASNSVTAVGVPDAPTIGTATGGDAQASVAFTPPGNNGGSAITSYKVYARSGQTQTGASSPIVITGLSNGQSVDFYVTATNAYGESVPSEYSNLVLPAGVPGAPIINGATAGNAQVSIAYEAGPSNGQAITQFTATSSPGGIQASGLANPLVVTGLTNGTAYTFTMTATNSVGTSPVSNTSASVTPATVPGAPTIGTATAGDASASVAFTPPASNGGSPITSYTAVATPGGATVTGSGSPLNVIGLQNGVAHTFVVYATNALGNSANSAASNSVTPQQSTTVPGAPTIGTASRTASKTCSVTFTPPANNGGSVITSYTATSSPGGITGTSASSPITVRETLGSELAPPLSGGTGWTASGTGAAYTGGQAVFTDASSTAVVEATGITALNDNTTYKVEFTVTGYVQGSVRVQVYGDTTDHLGTAGPVSANGTYTFYVTTSATGTLANRIRIQTNGPSSPGNTLTVTNVSVKEELATLVNGTPYTFTVTATNANGTGPASAASNAATPATVPGVPGTPTATGGNGQASLSFTAPSDNGGSAIVSYTATSSPGGIQRTMTADELAVGPLIVTGLTNGTAYTFTVVATNQYGSGSASAASNSVTPAAGGAAGPFDSLYAANWLPNENTTVFTKPVQSAPAKSTGISSVSYTDASYGTKVFRVAQLSDSPGQTGNSKMRHEYSRRCPWNCNQTKFIILNSNGFMFVYDADTFQRLDGGVTTVDQKQYAVGTNSIYPKDPRDWTWHPTDPNKIIFKSVADDLNFYEFDVVTKVLTTKFSFAGRLAAWGMGTGTNVTTGGEGRPSDNARYWGFMVKDSAGANLGYITYDMDTDTILGALVTSRSSNNVTMSSNGNYIIMSGPQGTSYEQARDASVLTGVRAYTRDFSSYKQLHYWGSHADIGIDYLGREVYITLNQGGSNWTAVPTNSVFMIPCAGTEGPTMLVDTGANSSQWNSHYSGCNTPGRPGWFVLSMWDTQDRGTREWLDDSVSLVELKPNPRILRIFEHRTRRFTYWQEPHSTISRDGLRVMSSVSWDNTSSTDPGIDYMVGLPSWFYGSTVQPPVGNNKITNGTFTGLTGWTVTNGGWVSSGGKAVFASGAGASTLQQAVGTLIPAKKYRITFTLSNYTGPGDMAVRLLGGTTVSSANINGNGAKSVDLIAATGNDTIGFHAFSTFNGSIDDAVMVEVVDNLIGNGTFNDATGWSLGTSCTVDSGSLRCNNTAGNSTNSYAVSLPAGTYRVTYELVSPFTSGNCTARFNTSGGVISGVTRSAGGTSPGTYTEDIVVTGTISAFEIRATRQGTAMDFRVDNIFIDKIA